MQKHEFGSTPRVATRRTTVSRLCIEKLAVSQKATIRCCVTSAVGAHPCARQFCAALRRRRSRGTRDPTDVATGPAARNRRYVKDRSSAISRGTWKSISNRRHGDKRKITGCENSGASHLRISPQCLPLREDSKRATTSITDKIGWRGIARYGNPAAGAFRNITVRNGCRAAFPVAGLYGPLEARCGRSG